MSLVVPLFASMYARLISSISVEAHIFEFGFFFGGNHVT
jgi:hypothetical protein